jgi:hypothetical protein
VTAPIWIALLSVPPFAVLSLYSVWRFIVAEQDPDRHASPVSLLQALYPWMGVWIAWHLLSETDPTAHMPGGSAMALCAFAWFCITVLHLYERVQPIPYDGFFPWWRGKKAAKRR